MRRDSGQRHPVFEGLVFGLAILLAGIVAFYGLQRWARGRAAPPPLPAPMDGDAPGARADGAPAARRVVPSLPPVRLSRVGGEARTRRVEVPAPEARQP